MGTLKSHRMGQVFNGTALKSVDIYGSCVDSKNRDEEICGLHNYHHHFRRRLRNPPSSHARPFERSSSLNIVTLCTGNVARSVMLGYMLATLAESSGEQWEIRTAGTHVVEGSAMSSRTRDALVKIEGLGEHRYGAHRSHQLTNDDATWSDVIIASEANHVNFVRRAFPDDSWKAVQLAQLIRLAPRRGSVNEQLRVTSALEPDPVFDIGDPAGGDQAVYDYCARELWSLARALTVLFESAT